MTEDVANLILEHLRLLRNEIKAQSVKSYEQFEMVHLRLSSIEGQFAGLHVDVAGVHVRIDRLDARMDRIERRLELADTE